MRLQKRKSLGGQSNEQRICVDGEGNGEMKKMPPEGVDHEAFEAAKTPNGLTAERKRYAHTWSEGDAASYEHQGHYRWMASQVQGHRRVLEIGTGDGRGTLELLRAGHHVISVDENPECLELAHSRLSREGFDVDLLLRSSVHQADDGYLVRYRSIDIELAKSGTLIEGDTLTDHRLLRWLKLQDFDAIVCWLVGSHRARQLNSKLPMQPADLYRLSVQNSLYELAEVILKPRGILNTIDRGTIGTAPAVIEMLRQDTVRAHADQASPTSLQVDPRVATVPFTMPNSGVPMQMTLGTSGLVPSDVTMGLASVVARKPAPTSGGST